MIKRNLSILISLLFIITLFNSCSQSGPIDYYEFSKRMEKIDKSYGFTKENIFLEDEVTYVFLTLKLKDDVLLSFENKENGDVELLNITIDGSKWSATRASTDFYEFVKAAFSAFTGISNSEAKKIADKMKLNEKATYFINPTEITEEIEGFSFTFYTNELGAVIDCLVVNEVTSQETSS